MDTYEATRSTTSAVGPHDQRDQRAIDSCKLSFQGAKSPKDLLVALNAHAVKMTGTSLYLGDVVNLMHNTGAGRYFPPGLARPEHARHPATLHLATWNCSQSGRVVVTWTWRPP